MGGIGSGCYEHRRLRGTVTHDRALDIRHWHREGLIKPGVAFDQEWRQQGRGIAGLAVTVHADRVVLAYRCTWSDGREAHCEYPVILEWTPCPFGGQRPWFICPNSQCGQRVAILSLSGSHFTCRHCQGLAYASQRENAIDRNLRRARKIRQRLGGTSTLPEKPKRMRWRTYQRLLSDANAALLRAMHSAIVKTEQQISG